LARAEHRGVKALSEQFAKMEQPDEDPDEAADMTAVAAAASSASQADMSSADALAAALERLAERRRQEAATLANAADKPAIYHTASLEETPASNASQRIAGPTPNQVILARGYWQGLPDGQTAAQPASASSPSTPSRKVAASAVPDIASALKVFSDAPRDRVPPDIALAYATQPEQEPPIVSPAPTSGPASKSTKGTQPVEVQARLPVPAPPVGTTIAMKRGADQAASTILEPPTPPSATQAPAPDTDNPWLRAVVLSPNVGRYLTTLMLGAADFRTLAALVEQPKSAVMMTFASEPNPGLTDDHFSGSAIVFVSTVTYQTRTTASLR
jgi:hypothetical protein